MTDYKKFVPAEQPIEWHKMPGHIQIMNERNRQVHEEGFDSEGDSYYTNGELVSAAIAYAHAPNLPVIKVDIDNGASFSVWRKSFWPSTFSKYMYKPGADGSTPERIKELVKAGALIAAEIDRLLNLQK